MLILQVPQLPQEVQQAEEVGEAEEAEEVEEVEEVDKASISTYWRSVILTVATWGTLSRTITTLHTTLTNKERVGMLSTLIHTVSPTVRWTWAALRLLAIQAM